MIDLTPDLPAYVNGISLRAGVLAAMLIAGFTIGAWLATGLFARVTAKLDQLVRELGKRLDRENRGIATLIYRGIAALLMLIIPALLVAALVHYVPNTQTLAALIAVLWFGRCFDTFTVFRAWRSARDGKLKLELGDYLFADTHGVIRHHIRARLDAFALGIIGAGFWYLVAGVAGGLVYLAVAAGARHFTRPIFGWAARHSFTLMDFMPRFFTRIFLILAAFFAPGARPFRSMFAPRWNLFTARLMNVSLGGPSPSGEQPWVGSGTPRPGPEALGRLFLLQLSATTLLLLALHGEELYKMLILVIK